MKERYYSLDLVKFGCAILIIIGHFESNYQFSFNYLRIGNMGYGDVVELFFLISGFLSAISIDKMLDTSFCEYISKKAIRIYPIVMLSVVVEYLVRLLFYRYDESIGLGKLFMSLTLIGKEWVYPYEMEPINHYTWYISVLVLCYVLFYFVVWISKRIQSDYIWSCIIVMLVGAWIVFSGVKFAFVTPHTGRGYVTFLRE